MPITADPNPAPVSTLPYAPAWSNEQVVDAYHQLGVNINDPAYRDAWAQVYQYLNTYAPANAATLESWLDLFRTDMGAAIGTQGVDILRSDASTQTLVYNAWQNVFSTPEWGQARSVFPLQLNWVSNFIENFNPANPTGHPLDSILTGSQRSAKANLESFLDQYGLQSLGDFVWQEYLNNIPVEQIMLDIRGRDEYKARFPAMDALAKQGHALSEKQYVEYERSAIELMRTAGMPQGFYDQPSDFQKLLESNVSLTELQSRIAEEYARVANTDPNIRQYFGEQYGAFGDAALAALYLDPDKALGALHKMSASAVFGGISRAMGEGVGFDTANLAAESGLTESGARSGLAKVAELHPLEQGTIGEGSGLTPDQLARGVFAFTPGAQSDLERRLQERQAEFGGSPGGGPIDTAQGALGLGDAGRARK